MSGTAAGADLTAADRGIPVQAGWQPAFPETGPNGRVSAFIKYGDGLVVAGRFSAAGGTAATNIALWDGSTWQALGDGLGGDANDVVHALAVHDGALIAAGEFRHAGDTTVNHIARWNGHAWSPLGPADTGMDRTIRALAVYQGELVAGGDFGQAGNITAHHIARWNGGSWLPLASGLDAEVEALAVFDGALYAGGLFFWAGNVKATGMARWDGSQWSGIRPDPVTMRRSIFSLLVHEDALYAGGWFTAPGNAVHRVARWDGADWTPLPGLDGPEVPYWVEALAVYRGGSPAATSGRPMARSPTGSPAGTAASGPPCPVRPAPAWMTSSMPWPSMTAWCWPAAGSPPPAAWLFRIWPGTGTTCSRSAVPSAGWPEVACCCN